MKLLVCLVITLLCAIASAQNILELMRNIDEVSEFLALIEENEVLPHMLRARRATVFAPTNEAMRRYKGKKNSNFVSYHFCNQDMTSEVLAGKKSVTTDHEGNTPLWITVKNAKKDRYEKQIFINNAKIIRDDERGQAAENKVQVLHIIDEVLEPVMAKPDSSVDKNPTALDLMKGGSSYELNNNFDVTKFAQAVKESKKENIFKEATPSTFFIPVKQDETGRGNYYREYVDDKVAGAHVVPGEVLFTRILDQGKTYPTATLADGLHIFLLMNEVEMANKSKIWLAQSQTVQGDFYHHPGVVGRRILKANVPLKNGVAHFIEKPLAVVDQSLSQFLRSEKDIRLSEFYSLISNHATEFFNQVMQSQNITLLAPSNEAFEHLEDQKAELIRDKDKLESLLNFHLINRPRLSFAEKDNQKGQDYRNTEDCDWRGWCFEEWEEKTKYGNKKVYFRVITRDNMRVLTVEGGGVNATVSYPDIATTRGIVHIIDRLLGLPFMTVGHKLENDPEISDTYKLGKQRNFNKKLRDKESSFTYFVPSNEAWDKIKRTMPSAHKKLFMDDFAYQTHQILDRHLLINGSFTMERLYEMSSRNWSIRTLRGELVIKAKGYGEYQVKWNGITADVVRPDVQCTNGMIHVLNTVLMKEKDVTVNMAASLGTSILTMMALVCAVKYLL